MADLMGIPATRPFRLKDATAKEPIFVTTAYHLHTYPGYRLDQYDTPMPGAGVKLSATADFEGKKIIGFSRTELKTLLERTDTDLESVTPSSKKHIYWFKISDDLQLPEELRADMLEKPGKTGLPVEIETEWNGSNPEIFRAIAGRVLGPALNRPIRISVPHANQRDYPQKSKKFEIFVWSTPHRLGEPRQYSPDTMFDIPVSLKDRVYAGVTEENRSRDLPPSIYIMDGEYAVAELFPNALYIHHDLVHYGNQDEFRIFTQLLERVAVIVANKTSWEEQIAKAAILQKELRARKRKEQLERQERELKELVVRSVKKREHRTKGALETAKARARTLREQYFQAERDLFALTTGDTNTNKVADRFLAELQRLERGEVEHIETLELLGGSKFKVHTKEIIVLHPTTGAEYLLGRFEILLDLDNGMLPGIKNKDRTVVDGGGHTCHAPHVFNREGTNICLGNIGGEVGAYIAHFEVEAAASLLVAFLQSVNPDSGYVRRLEQFPMVKAGKRAA